MENKTRWPGVDPKLVAFSENIWRPGKAVPDPKHVPPTIDKEGGIVGETNPRVVPETEAEVEAGMKNNLWRNMQFPNDPDYPPMLAVDEKGHIIDMPSANSEPMPETDNEREFIKRLKKRLTEGKPNV